MNEEMGQRKNLILTNGVPDKDKATEVLALEFAAELLLGLMGETPDAIASAFYRKYKAMLDWLGDDRQDAIIIYGMEKTGVDLSHLLGEQE